jgi:hypothetical protein|tara:strand:- start:1039 stop:1338 length:300 start_codon:yes stop_codon:yes gene_type:complete
MKKILFPCMIFISLGTKGCMSVDEKGRLEKIRFSVPAFFQVEMDYYKDRENIGRPVISTNSPAIVNLKPENLSFRTNAPIDLWEPAGKLMEMTPKKSVK